MKRLAILSFVVLLFAGCGGDNEAGSQGSTTAAANSAKFTKHGLIMLFPSDTLIGEWHYSPSDKVINVAVNRSLVDRMARIEGTSQYVVENHLLSLEYSKGDDFISLGALFANSLTTAIPNDVECGFNDISALVNACLNISLYDASGHKIVGRFADFE